MNKIVVLERNTRDQIAAGEVAERPALIVKELVENAIDAGATTITIDLKEGGLSRIRVVDNGGGIAKEDIPYAFLRHATSKIRHIEDLDTLTTMGFRGEALASIAAVSKVRLTTKTADGDGAYGCTLDAGTISDILPAAGNDGTEIIIDDLFFNTPARKKFLATPVREMREISDIVGRFIIAYPELSFSLTNDGKRIFHSPGKGEGKEAIATVYGRELLPFLLPLNGDSGFEGYVAHPNYSKPNRNFFHFYINRRYIQSNELNKALENAYKTLLPERRFPVAFINVDLAPDQYDINVHPNKLEVKFHRDVPVGDRLYRAVKEALSAAAPAYTTAIKEDFDHDDEADRDVYKIHQDLRPAGLAGAVEIKRRAEALAVDEDLPRVAQRNAHRGMPLTAQKERTQLKQRTSPEIAVGLLSDSGAGSFYDSLPSSSSSTDFWYAPPNDSPDAPVFNGGTEQKIDFQEGFYTSLRLLGQFAGAFIVACNDEALYLIDQHAAHERLLFNKIRASIVAKDAITQPLIVPVEVKLDRRQYQWVLENIIVLTDMGFVLEEFGDDAFVLREVPLWAEGIDEVAFLKEFADGWLESEAKLSIDAVMERKIMSKACKKAVKANWHLSNADILYLFEQLDKAEDAFTCPHGRPITIKFTENEIRRKFLRT